MICGAFLKARRLLSEFLLRRRFRVFGRHAVLLKPYMTTNPHLIEIGNNVFIREYARIEAITGDGSRTFSPLLRIRDGAHIEQFFHVGACEYVEIGENVLIAGRVYISDHDHEFKDITAPIRSQGVRPGGKVVIEQNAWLGEGCVVLPGVTIGRNSVVGSNAVVTRNIPPYSIAVGIPARVIKRYDFDRNDWVSV